MPANTRLLSLAAGVLPDHTPEVLVEAAAAAGFGGVGIWIEVELWTDARVRALRRHIADCGLHILDAEVIWIRPGALAGEALRAIEIAGELGAPNVLAVSTDPDVGATAAKFAALCRHAQPAGLNVALEFMAFLAVPDLRTALEVIGRAEQPNARLLIDPIHLSRSGGTPADLVSVPPGLFSYAQFCDAPQHMPDLGDKAAIRREALDGRLMPGEGSLPLAELLAVLPPGLPLSVELRSKALREGWPDPRNRARHLWGALQRYSVL